MTLLGVPRDVGDILNTVERRLGMLERKSRGFTIPPATGGGISTYASDTMPPGPNVVGDLWIDTSDGSKIYRWNGTAWASALDPRVDIVRNEAAVELAAWQDTVATADGLVTTYLQTTPPTGAGTGDLWVRTTDNELFYWTGLGWADQGDTSLGESIRRPENASTVADGEVRTWWQYNPPTAEGFGDLWVNTAESVQHLYRWNNFEWVQILDWAVADASNQISGKISSYYASAPPTSTATGDLWFDTNNGNRQYRAEAPGATTIAAGQWVAVPAGLGALSPAVTARALGSTITTTNTSPPPGPLVGDVWVDTTNGNKHFLWNGTSWEPITTDGVPPVASPVAIVEGGIGSLFVRWTAINNQSEVTYDVHVAANPIGGASFTTTSATLQDSTTGTMLSFQDSLPKGGALDKTGTIVYYARIVARDDDGAAAPGAGGSDTVKRVQTVNIEPAAIVSSSIADFAIPVVKLHSLTHMIY